MSVSDADVVQVFRFLLGRKPKLDPVPTFESRSQMYAVILNSPEFKASARAIKNTLAWPLSQVFISQKAGVIYCPIGKNACTFLKRQVAASSGVDHLPVIMNDIHRLTDLVNTGLQLSDYDPADVEAFLGSPDFVKIAVLRDPHARILSAYTEKFVRNRTAQGNINHTKSVINPVQSALGLGLPDYDLGISFRDFVTFITDQPQHRLDPHWRPQSLYLQGITYDRLFQFDELDQIIDLLELRSGLTLERRAQNVTRSGVGVSCPGADRLLPQDIIDASPIHKSSFYPPDLFKMVQDYFADDQVLIDKIRTTRPAEIPTPARRASTPRP